MENYPNTANTVKTAAHNMEGYLADEFKVKSSVHTASDTANRLYYIMDSAGNFSCTDDYFLHRSGFKSYLLLYTLSGQGLLKYRGQEYTLEARSLFFIDCDEEQFYGTVPGKRWEFEFAHIRGLNVKDYFELCMKNSGPAIHSFNMEAAGILSDIMELKESEDILFEPKASLLISRLLVLIATVPFYNSEYRSQNEWVTRVTEYIKENFMQPITDDELAKIACLSKFHFIRNFKMITGYSPYKFLIQYRLNLAKRLLTDTSKNIENIAEDAGFCTASAFVSVFKRIEGTTPKQYRKLHDQITPHSGPSEYDLAPVPPPPA
jgi:AraC-like DNA-binding protein